MGYIEKTDKIKETKLKLKNNINDLGSDITSSTPFRDYVDKLTNIYNALPKVTGTGTELTLENTKSGKMVIQPKGNTSQAILPSEYQQVEYIESTGTQYIDTGVKCLQTTTFEITNNFNILNEIQLFGAFANSKRTHYGINSSQIYMPTVTDGTTTEHIFNGDTQYHTYYLSTSQYKYDNTIVASGNFEFPIDSNFFLFARNNGGTVTNYCKSRLKKAKIYNNNVLICDFIPCYRKSDNEIGLYNLVNNVFYTNDGTGTFNKGNDVPNPDYPQEIKNVTGDNNIVIRGKNLFDGKVEQGAISSNIGQTYEQCKVNNTTRIRIKNLIKLDINKNYTISIETGYDYVIQAFDINGTLYDGGQGTWKSTATTITNIPYIALAFKKANEANIAPSEINNLKIIIEENNYATTYEPYITPIEKELNLENVELCKIGDYQDYIYKENGNWYKKKWIERVILDGTENWRSAGVSNVYYDATTVYDYNKSNNIPFCNIFQGINNVSTAEDIQGVNKIGFNNTAQFVRIYIAYSGTVYELKELLSQKNAILYYALEESTDILITNSTLINQLEDLSRTIIPSQTIVVETESEEENAKLNIAATALKAIE